MTVEEIQSKLPEARVYKLDPDARYLILCNEKLTSEEGIKFIAEQLSDIRIEACIMSGPDPEKALRILELKP